MEIILVTKKKGKEIIIYKFLTLIARLYNLHFIPNYQFF